MEQNNDAYLEKPGKKNIEFCALKNENALLHILIGKNNRVTSSMVRNCGNNEKAFDEMLNIISQYQVKGYILYEKKSFKEEIIFDKAKWHFNNDFPEDLSEYQAYIHTGFFLGWLIKHNLISEELNSECKEGIKDFLEGRITSSQFYKDYLDGVFTSEDVNSNAIDFVCYYFDFEKGYYLKDYEQVLASNLPTLYHVKDTTNSFEKISAIINNRYKEFLSKRA